MSVAPRRLDARALGYGSLAEQLPRFDPAAARLRRQLFARSCRLASADGSLSLQLGQPGGAAETASEWMRLRGDELRVWLRVQPGPYVKGLGDGAWHDYHGESRTLAWSLAHESVLTAFHHVFGVALEAEDAVVPEQSPDEWRTLDRPLDWRLDHRGASIHGRIALSPAALARIAAIERWQPAASRASTHCAALPASARLSLRAPAISAAALREFETGDVLVLDTYSRCRHNLALEAAGRHWAVRLDERSRPMLLSSSIHPPIEPSQSRETHTMSDAPPQPAGDAAEAAPATSPLDAAMLELTFDIGTLPSSVGELAALQAGYVFELPQTLEQTRTTIRANGRAVGHGELVAVGDSLGVLILDLDGLQ